MTMNDYGTAGEPAYSTTNPPPPSDTAAPADATPQVGGPFDKAIRAALEEITRLEGLRDQAASAAKSAPTGISGKAERDRAQARLNDAEAELARANRQYQNILARAAAAPSAGGSTPSAAGKSITWIRRQLPDGAWVEDAYSVDLTKPTGQQSTRATDIPSRPASAPTGTATAASRPPSDPSQWQPIKGPDGKTLALQDPATGDRVAVPAGPVRKSGTEDSVSGGYVFHWSYDDQGNPHLTGKDQIADPNKIPDGTKTYINQGGWGIPAVYRGGQAIPTGEQAVPLTPETAGAPTEGKTRPAVVDGYNVTQTYSGGQWVTSSVGTRATPQPVQQVNASATEKNLTTYDPNTGTYSQTPNQNYQPGDVAGKVQQLQQQAQAKRDELNKAVQSGQKTGEQAAAEFDTWWNGNVEPQKAQLQQAQQTAQTDATIKQNTELRNQQAAEQSAFTTAQGAGRDAVAAAQAGLVNRVGPGFGAALNNIQQAYASGKAPGNFDIGSAVTYDMPDFSKISEQATAQALAHLSPTAAGKVGLPMPGIPQGVDISGALNKSQYTPTTTIAPDGTVTITHAQPGGYQGAPNPNVFGSGTGNVMQPLPPALAPNEQQIFGNYAPPG